VSDPVSVALPVLNGGQRFREVLAAIAAQRLDRAFEIVVIDSGSTDGSVEAARAAGARVLEIPRAEFSHGGTRNRLMELASGSHVAFLTQDAVPAHDGWLAALLSGFGLADDVALVAGPYLPQPGASAMVRRDLEGYFARFGDAPRVDGLDGGAVAPGPATFYSSANGAVARRAWERVRFRDVRYGEDQQLAVDLLHAGWRKAYVPEAGAVHSHEYEGLGGFRRAFDEFRALREVYDHREPLSPRFIAARGRNDVRADRAYAARHGMEATGWRSLAYQGQRALGRALGANADRLPRQLRGWCSLEGRDTFEPTARA
jgi:glycosyltransferase involved in cell wall biosynthesis